MSASMLFYVVKSKGLGEYQLIQREVINYKWGEGK